jgi:cytochrome P450
MAGEVSVQHQATLPGRPPTMTMPATGRPATAAQAKPQRHPLAHIPGEEGWPIVGNTFAALKDPVGHAEVMHRRHGPVYRDRLFGVRSVAMLGPEANELVLFDRDRNFSSSHGWGYLLDRLFPRGLMLMDFDEHRLHRRALGVAFKPAPMKAYLDALNDGISRRIAEWHLAGGGQGSSGDFRFYPAIKQLTLDLAATSFLGIDLGSQANAVNRAFIDMVAAITGVVRTPMPGTQMRKGVVGREAIVAFFFEEIPKRRAGQATDLFSELCRATKEDGSLLTDQEIADHMSFLMMAAHDTLTSSVTSLVYLLAKHPEWQEKLRGEMHGLGLPPGAPLPYGRLDELALVEMAFKEAMRINPPVPGIPRAAVRDFVFRGHRIPAGTRVAISPLFTHRMAELWPEPLKFDPLRFADRAVRTRHKYAWVPFGGGAHMCIGLHFAHMQAKSFFYHLLTTTRANLAQGYVPRWQMWPIPKPRDGLPIRIERWR